MLLPRKEQCPYPLSSLPESPVGDTAQSQCSPQSLMGLEAEMVYPGEHPLLPSPPSAGALPAYTPVLGVMDISMAAVSVTEASGWASLMDQTHLPPQELSVSRPGSVLWGRGEVWASTARAETFPDLLPSSSTSRDSPSNRRSTRATCQAAIRNGGCELCNIYI